MNIDSIKIYPDIHRSKFKDWMQERNVSEGNKWTSVGLCDEKQLNRGYQSGSLARENNFGAVTFGSAASNIQKTVKDNLFDKILKLCDKHTVIAQNLVALVLAVGFRPLAIMALPGKKDEDKGDKIYASGHAIASGLIGFAFSTVVMYPLGQAADKAKKMLRQAKTPDAKDLPKDVVNAMKKAFKVSDLAELEHSKAFKNVTKILDMAPDVFIFGVAKAILTIKLIKPILKYVFGLEKKQKPVQAKTEEKPVQQTPMLGMMKPEIAKFAGGLK